MATSQKNSFPDTWVTSTAYIGTNMRISKSLIDLQGIYTNYHMFNNMQNTKDYGFSMGLFLALLLKIKKGFKQGDN